MSAPAFTVLFDLDGTFLDTAPDMIAALNRLRQERDLAPLPDADLRGAVSHGSMAMIQAGFQLHPDDPDFAPLQHRFLNLYERNLATLTRPFQGMDTVIDTLDQQHIRWGIVTNKPGYLTEPLLATLNLSQRCACIISGDTLPQRKPDPEPLLHACRLAGGSPKYSIYVGDAERDIEAGRRAGMKTLAAMYGYISAQDPPERWQADHLIQHPLDILARLQEYQAEV